MGEYCDKEEAEYPPSTIHFTQIVCQLARGTIQTVDPPLWITTSMQNVRLVSTMLFHLNI